MEVLESKANNQAQIRNIMPWLSPFELSSLPLFEFPHRQPFGREWTLQGWFGKLQPEEVVKLP